MLDAECGELEVVTVPTPIPLHAPMHRACVERGLACYLEKPPTLYHAELDEMLAVEARAARQTQVAFNFIVEDSRQALKRRILAGEFGRVLRAGSHGHWPRPTTYFTRSAWAGRLFLGGRPVLDSCIGNAMAHYVHSLLFWCGDSALLSWAEAALAAQGEMAAVALYAALLDGNITTLILEAPPATQDAPSERDGRGPAIEMLNCLRVTDLPFIAGLLFPTELVFVGNYPVTYEWAESLYSRLGEPGRFRRVDDLAAWQPNQA
jgi:hypothetical protein